MLSTKQSRSLDQYKKPIGKDNYVGIELEFSSPSTEENLKEVIIKYNLQKYIRCGEDGEASEPLETSYELACLIKQKEIAKIIPIIGNMLKEVKANINKSHGMHVHLDMRNRRSNKAFNNLVKAQDLLFSIADPSRSGNIYCEYQEEYDLNNASEHHYSAINPVLEKGTKETIEVRIREGLVDAKEIQNWVNLLNQIADADHIYDPVQKLSDLKKVIKVNSTMSKYINKKIRQNISRVTKLKESDDAIW